MNELSPDERAQRRRLVRYSIKWLGLPWAVLAGGGAAYRSAPPGASLGSFLLAFLVYAVFFLPFGAAFGWMWARGMWAFGVGRHLPK